MFVEKSMKNIRDWEEEGDPEGLLRNIRVTNLTNTCTNAHTQCMLYSPEGLEKSKIS